jgi:transposase
MHLQNRETRIFLRPGKTDFRKSINGLSVMVQEHMDEDPFSGHYYVFCNRTKTMLKILYWDRNGFCLWHKRLEEDKFRWPNVASEIHEINREEFRWLLLGLDFYNAHKIRRYASVS